MKCFVFIVLFCIAMNSAVAEPVRQQTGEIKIGTEYTYRSAFMGEDIQYRVSLPYYYDMDPTKKFAVIYVLDGHIPNMKSVSTLSNELWGLGPEMPDVIVVGIPSNDRRRDYTPVSTDLDLSGERSKYGIFLRGGGASKYKHFLKADFIPHIEQHYRTNGHRILIGHSLGGLFVLNDVMSNDQTFQSFIAVDPSLGYADNYIVKRLQKLSDKALSFGGGLYVSVALRGHDLEDASLGLWQKGKNDRFKQLSALLMKKSSSNFSIKVEAFPAEDHSSVVSPTHRAGLRYVFEGYLPFQNSNPLKSLPTYKVAEYFAEKPDELIEYYKNYSERVGINYSPEQRLTEFAIYSALNNKLYDNAYKLIQLNIQKHPELDYSWVQLGEYYDRLNDNKAAMNAYTRALELNPENSRVKARLTVLSKK